METPASGKYDKGEIKHFTEKSVYAAAIEDIQRARKSICIASPYVARSRVQNVIDLLVEQMRRGIHLEIFTKPPQEGGWSPD